MRRLVPLLAALAIVVLAAILVSGSPSSARGLTSGPWQWVESTAQSAAAPSLVPDPAAYTIDFRPDSTFRAKADCNDVSGDYRATPAGRMGPWPVLTITPGPSTLVACGAGSLSETYVQELARASTYRIAGGHLTITLADGGSMTFR